MRTHPTVLSVLALPLFFFLSTTSPVAADQSWRDCEQTARWDQRIAGCTAVLARGSAETARSRARALALRAQAHQATNALDKAVADAGEALLFDPGNTVALSSRGLAYEALGEDERAIKDWSEFIRLAPSDPMGFTQRGMLYLNVREDAAAIADLSEVIRLFPTSAAAFINRCWAYVDKKDFDLAIKDCDEASRLDPNGALDRVGRGRGYAGKGQFDRAIEEYDAAIRRDPGNAMAFIFRGQARARKPQPEPDQALKDYEEAIRLDSKSVAAYVGRGQVYAGKGDSDRAVADYDQAIRIDRKAFSAFLRRGQLHAGKGAHDRAIEDYDEAIRIDPKDAEAFDLRAASHVARDEHRKALTDYDAALALDASLASAKDGREKVLALLERAPDPDRQAEARPPAPQPTPETTERAPPVDVAIAQPPASVENSEASPQSPTEESSTAQGLSGRRFALVVGIDDYWVLDDLRAARNDARAVGKTLSDLGFTVLEGENLDHGAMSTKLTELAQQIEPGDAVFVFFAGHGFSVGPTNYLLPADMPMVEKGQEGLFNFKAFAADQIVELIQTRGARTAILVLDACRNNPFERPGARALLPGSRGLSRTEPPEGVFVLYSAASKQVALDRLDQKDTNPNSVFTRVFVEELKRPDVPFAEVADRTRRRVRDLARKVGKDQRPALYNEIVEPFVLK